MLGGNFEPKKYDFVIGNPPYVKIAKDAPEATAMPGVCYGTPNLYFIFAAMGFQKEHEYVVTDQKGLMQDNRNYLFVKRFTAKEERRRLKCGIYLSKKYPQDQKISTQNKINFVDGLITEMSECLVYGLYVIFNSTLYDEYYKILNGSTQVNSTEINAMPLPDLESIQEVSRTLMKSKAMSESKCNMILHLH